MRYQAGAACIFLGACSGAVTSFSASSDSGSPSPDSAAGGDATIGGHDASVPLDASPEGRVTATDGSPEADAGSFEASSETGDSTSPDAPAAADGGADDSAGRAEVGPISDGWVDDDSPQCVQDLSNTGTGKFSIAFAIQTTTVHYVSLLNQRAYCFQPPMGGPFWQVRFDPRNELETIDFEFFDTYGQHVTYTANAILNDNMLHEVAISRVEATMTIEVDGEVVVGTMTDGDGGQSLRLLQFGDLPELKVGVADCDYEDEVLPLDHGTISQICISR